MSDRVTFQSRIVVPIACERLDRAPTSDAHDALQAANGGVLAFLLHNIETEATPRPSDERMAEALAPLQLKLDLIVEMMARLSYREVQLPAPREIEFGLDHLVWVSPHPLRVRDWLLFKLYLHPTLLDPVAFYGQVTGSTPSFDGGYRTEAALLAMPEETGESLARLAFLVQRRQLARRPATAAATTVRGER